MRHSPKLTICFIAFHLDVTLHRASLQCEDILQRLEELDVIFAELSVCGRENSLTNRSNRSLEIEPLHESKTFSRETTTFDTTQSISISFAYRTCSTFGEESTKNSDQFTKVLSLPDDQNSVNICDTSNVTQNSSNLNETDCFTPNLTFIKTERICTKIAVNSTYNVESKFPAEWNKSMDSSERKFRA